MINEIVNNKIVDGFGNEIDQNYGFDPFGDYSYLLDDDLYKTDFEILEDPTGQLYYNFL